MLLVQLWKILGRLTAFTISAEQLEQGLASTRLPAILRGREFYDRAPAKGLQSNLTNVM